MFLHSLTVENYRALRSARVNFDETTVLIGENDCGKSSLLEALAITLNAGQPDAAPEFQPYHFHRLAPRMDAQVAGPIRIELCFRERHADEWEQLRETPLACVLGPPATGLRELVLEVRAEPSDQDSTPGQCFLRMAGLSSSDPQALAYLRRMHPLIWLHGGSLFGGAYANSTPLGQRIQTLSPEIGKLAERIDSSYSSIVGGTAPDVQTTLREGFDAARNLIELTAQHLGTGRHEFHEMVAEILGHEPEPRAGQSAPRHPHFSGVAAERIGVLLLMATLLRAIPEAMPPGAEPIWVIEDPEAQLHPMTLAAVLDLVGRISWQKIMTTQSGDVLAAKPLSNVRRLVRHEGMVREWRVRPRSLSAEDLRRVGYHLRARHGTASFARCWLLVEGETEFWVLPELARIMGYNFALEGVACVEFAQCGLRPLIKLARELGIEWHVLCDGDRAGEQYAEQSERFVRGEPVQRRVSVLRERDIEHCFYENGYADVFRRLAGVSNVQIPARHVIEHAIHRYSKPMLALELILSTASRDAQGVPAPLARTVKTCIDLARSAPSHSKPQTARLRFQ